MKQRILLLLFIAFTCNVYAQDSSTFKLKDYKYRTPGYKALQLSLSSSGGQSEISFPNVDDKNSYFQIWPSRVEYQRVVSTERKQSYQNFRILPYLSTRKTVASDITTKSLFLQSDLFWTINQRTFKKNDWFIEWTNMLFGGFDQNKKTDPYIRELVNQVTVGNEFSIGTGKGRIENVQDAQVAMYIINDLQQQGLTSQVVDGNIINELAKLVTDLNNRRIFDYRRRRIYELTQIDQFLLEKGIANHTDIRHFTVINDNWAFAFNPLRRSGTSWSFNLRAGASFNCDFSERKNVNVYTVDNRKYSYNLGPQIKIEKYAPVNLKWQKNMGATLTGLWNLGRVESESAYNGNITRFKDSSSYIRSSLNLFYGLGFFPNNRTAINADIYFNVFRDWGKDQNLIETYTLISPSIYLNTNYFLGYRTRLQVGINLFYDRQYAKQNNLAEGHVLNKSFSLSLEHTIF
ncbi:MAG: hypothetical protein ACXWV2_10005 [Chitinophagaceae bacterium]